MTSPPGQGRCGAARRFAYPRADWLGGWRLGGVIPKAPPASLLSAVFVSRSLTALHLRCLIYSMCCHMQRLQQWILTVSYYCQSVNLHIYGTHHLKLLFGAVQKHSGLFCRVSFLFIKPTQPSPLKKKTDFLCSCYVVVMLYAKEHLLVCSCRQPTANS